MKTLLALLLALPLFTRAAAPPITAIHPPDNGIQPQAAIDASGKIHLIYLKGADGASDIFYTTSTDAGKTWAKSLRVNSQPGAAVAAGTVRGAHLALAKADRPHIAWMGSMTAQPKGPNDSMPMLYTRLNDAKSAFEPQRNLITTAPGLDGGGSIAADNAGNIYVAWHAPTPGLKGEENRTVWLTKSTNDGKTFTPESKILADPTGVCGCCGMRIGLDAKGNVVALYRSANPQTRDIHLLEDSGKGKFSNATIDTLAIKTCPMSTASISRAGDKILAAWESGGQVSFGALNATGQIESPQTAPGKGNNRKHPSIALDKSGFTLLAWTEGTAWKKGGALFYQLYDQDLKPIGTPGTAANLAAWSLPTAIPTETGFIIIY